MSLKIIINKLKLNKVSKNNNNPTTIIKCKFSNAVHKILEPNLEVKGRDRWKHKKEYTNSEKLEMIEQILLLHKECSNELTSYQFEKREKRRIHKARVERGYEFKKKIKKEDYEKNLVVQN
jgi:hypothetical protein